MRHAAGCKILDRWLVQAVRAARLAAVFVIICVIRDALAEPVPLPVGSGPVPQLSGAVKGGAIVSSQHAHLYRSVLPAEVIGMVVRGDLAFEAATVTIPEPSLHATPKVFSITDSGELDSDITNIGVPLFSVAASDMGALSAKQKGYRLLWNAEAVRWSERASSEDLVVSVFADRAAVGQQLQVDVARVYPPPSGQEASTTKALFRERIAFRSPSALEGLSWLSIRLRGVLDDYVWAASPLTGSVRQLVGGVRSEEIFPGGFAATDLGVWSGKIESVEPRRVERLAMLVPVFGEVLPLSRHEDGSCLGLTKERPRLLLNMESHRFAQHPGWIPTNVRFVPRWVWRLDLFSKDPFDSDAIQSVFIDEESLLPVYRISWNEQGALRKVVLGVLGFLGYENHVRPWLIGELIQNLAGTAFVAVRATNVELCTGSLKRLALSEFDPAVLQAQLELLKKKAVSVEKIEETGMGPESE